MSRSTLIAAALLAAGAAAHAAGNEQLSAAGARGFESAAVAPAAAVQKAVMTVEAPRSRPAGDPLFEAARFEKVRDHRGGRGGRGGRGADCRGYDRGHEEHWGGHGGRGYSPHEACRECLGRHGECTFRCTVDAYRCKATWVRRDGTQGESYEGRPRRDPYDAEDEAKERCRDANWNNREQGECRIVERCREESETVDSGRCRR